jgi:hypothetical protein
MIITGAILAIAAIVLLLMGKRRQSRGVVVLGVIALVLSVGVVTTHALGVKWDRLKPYAVLEYEIRWAQKSNPARADALMNEVKWRLSKFKLDPQRLWPLVEPSLKAHGDLAADWSNLDLDLIETYDHWVGLNAKQALAFRKNSIRTVIEVRPEVRVGDTLPILIRTWDSRTSTRFNAWKDYRILSCSLGGKVLVPRYDDSWYWVRRTGEAYPPESVFSQVQMELAEPGLVVGQQPLVLEIEHRVHESDKEEPLATWVETIEQTVDVLPQSVDEVDGRISDEPCPIEGNVSVEAIYVQQLSRNRNALWLYLTLDGAESACSFELLARSEASEIPLGLVHFIPSDDPTGEGNNSICKVSIETNKRIVAEQADLVFRATPQAIRSSVRVFGPWPDEFIVPDIPIRWPPRGNSRVRMNEYLTELERNEIQSAMRSIDWAGRLKGAPEASWR